MGQRSAGCCDPVVDAIHRIWFCDGFTPAHLLVSFILLLLLLYTTGFALGLDIYKKPADKEEPNVCAYPIMHLLHTPRTSAMGRGLGLDCIFS